MLDILALMMKSKLFRHFTRNECLGICQISCPREKQFEKNRIIVSQGDKAAYIGIIHNGRIAGSKFYDNGDSHLFHIWSENDILGLEAAFSTLGTYPFTLTALENLSVLIFARDKILSDLLSMEIKNKLFLNIIAIQVDENIRQMYKMEVLSMRSLQDKIMAFLHIMQDKKGSNSFFIKMNQQEFARYLGVNRSALSSELNNMKREGLIDFNKDYYTILKN